MKPKINKSKFSQFVGNIYYFYRFCKDGEQYEICIEPCYYGFDVAIYRINFGDRKLISYDVKQCTNNEEYQNDTFKTRERDEKTWNLAIDLAIGMMAKNNLL